MSTYFKDFEESVISLADTLPQWNSDNIERRIQSSVASLFEEAGELSGLVSKYRTRKSYYNANPKELEDFDKIKEKFVDEAGDFLWVLICSIHCLLGDNKFDTEKFLTEDDSFSLTLETSLFDVISDIVTLQQHIMFNDNVIDESIVSDFEYLISSFDTFLHFLNKEYDITLEEICKYNMDKLNKRYN